MPAEAQSSMPTFASRRVLVIPKELAPLLNACALAFRSCVCCAEEVDDGGRFDWCEDCNLPLYCSESCRDQDSEAHKHDGYCRELKDLRDQLTKADVNYRVGWFPYHQAQSAWYRERFGDAFNGENHHILMGGRRSGDPYYKHLLDYENELALKLARHPSSVDAVEYGLQHLLDLKQETYLADPYNLDVSLVCALLKLYREDDTFSYILYWLDWRSRGPEIENLRDPVIENRKSTSTWPFPITKDARLDDIVEPLRSFPSQRAGVSVPIEFALAVLVIKVRYITVYLKRAEAETWFLYLHKGGLGLKMLDNDHRAHILSFLVEGGRGRYFAQLNQVHRLMDYIDERDETLLPALVDRRIRWGRNVDRRIRWGRNALCFETFLKDYANGEPVIRTIKSMLVERYAGTTAQRQAANGQQNKRAAEHNDDGGSRKRPRHGEEPSWPATISRWVWNLLRGRYD